MTLLTRRRFLTQALATAGATLLPAGASAQETGVENIRRYMAAHTLIFYKQAGRISDEQRTVTDQCGQLEELASLLDELRHTSTDIMVYMTPTLAGTPLPDVGVLEEVSGTTGNSYLFLNKMMDDLAAQALPEIEKNPALMASGAKKFSCELS